MGDVEKTKKTRRRVDAGAGKQKKTKSASTTEGMVIILGLQGLFSFN